MGYRINYMCCNLLFTFCFVLLAMSHNT